MHSILQEDAPRLPRHRPCAELHLHAFNQRSRVRRHLPTLVGALSPTITSSQSTALLVSHRLSLTIPPTPIFVFGCLRSSHWLLRCPGRECESSHSYQRAPAVPPLSPTASPPYCKTNPDDSTRNTS